MGDSLHIAWLAGVAMLLAACDKPIVIDLDDDPNPPYRFHPPQRPEPIADAAALWPLADTDHKYLVIASNDAQELGDTLELDLERVDAEQGLWELERPDRRIEYLRVDEAGNVVITAVDDLNHQVTTLYDPPMVLVPTALAPGEAKQFTSRVTIVRRDNRAIVRDQGEATKTITHQADQRVTTPTGEYTAHQLKVVMDTTLRLAKVHHDNTLWLTPGVGPVALEQSEQVTALVVSWSNTRKMVLKQRVGP